MTQVLVVKAEDSFNGQELHLVYGEVYAPNRPDAQGEFMTKEEIRKMAHQFVRDRMFDQIDVMHNNKVVKCEVVESWVAPDGDTTFLPGSWCVGIHIPDEGLWSDFKSGVLNGFSMEALVTKEEREVEIEIPDEITGSTSETGGHVHQFVVKYDADGKFAGGRTDCVDGHVHLIAAGTHTQPMNGHTHRFSSVDQIEIHG